MAVPGLTINHHNQNQGGHSMKESVFANYDELMNEKDFPSIRVGSRIVVPKEKFRQWVEQQTGGAK